MLLGPARDSTLVNRAMAHQGCEEKNRGRDSSRSNWIKFAVAAVVLTLMVITVFQNNLTTHATRRICVTT